MEFHEAFGFPVFWLAPDRLRYQGRERQLAGHISIYADTDVDGKFLDAPRTRANDKTGNPWPEPREDQSPIVQLWRGSSADDLPGGLATSPRQVRYIDEFVHLLGRPDLMLAADAIAMSALPDGREKLLSYLEKLAKPVA